ncbi:hypothetical protein L7F22_019901 [Adiantum nelumboides]|nr:hypothetical protein [Adiantum nelumboides]
MMMAEATKDKKSTKSNVQIKTEPRSPSSSSEHSTSIPPAVNSLSAHAETASALKVKMETESSPSPSLVKPIPRRMKVAGRGYYSKQQRDARHAIRTMYSLRISDHTSQKKNQTEKKFKKEEQ